MRQGTSWDKTAMVAEAVALGHTAVNERNMKMPRQILSEPNCAACGWPIKKVSSAVQLTRVRNHGVERAYKHARCPSLSERRELRRQMLEEQ